MLIVKKSIMKNDNNKWSPELHRDDFCKRCFQTCGAFKLLRWCGKLDFIGVCTEGHMPISDCKYWRSDGNSVDPLLRDGKELLLFPL